MTYSLALCKPLTHRQKRRRGKLGQCGICTTILLVAVHKWHNLWACATVTALSTAFRVNWYQHVRSWTKGVHFFSWSTVSRWLRRAHLQPVGKTCQMELQVGPSQPSWDRWSRKKMHSFRSRTARADTNWHEKLWITQWQLHKLTNLCHLCTATSNIVVHIHIGQVCLVFVFDRCVRACRERRL